MSGDRFRVTHRELSEEEADLIREFKTHAGEMAVLLYGMDPRCKAVVLTKLEEAVMWMTKGMTGG